MFRRGCDVPWEDAFSVSDSACPPVCLVVCPLQNRDDLALLEAQIARLVCVKGELGNRLVGL